MKPYFAIDEDRRIVVSEEGDEFTAEQFERIVQRSAAKDVFYDMTLATQRFILLGYDWDKLDDFYKSC